MKKYVLNFSAILLAAIFSAFTTDTVEQKSSAIEQELYWYRIVNGNIDEELADGVKVTKSTVFSEAGCPDLSGDDCARGYEEEQDFGDPAPTVSGMDTHIRKD